MSGMVRFCWSKLRARELIFGVYAVSGERTPVAVRLANPPASIPAHWTMCKTARRFRTTLSDMLAVSPEKIPMTKELDHGVHETQEIRKFVERVDGTTIEGEW